MYALAPSEQEDGHIPKGPIFPDVTNLTQEDLPEKIDAVIAGFPCQDAII